MFLRIYISNHRKYYQIINIIVEYKSLHLN